jgi:hypothetical protein
MDFSEKAKKIFYDDLKLNNRQISQRMNNYSEVLVSRYMKDKEPSATFVKKIKQYFPELAHIDWFDIGNGEQKLLILQEKGEEYISSMTTKIDRIINELQSLKESLSHI